MRRDEQTPEGLRVKLPAAALIERAGWKGRVDGPVEAWRRQPLVLVNRGGARRADVLATAARIQDDVRVRFGVLLQVEPRLAFPGLRA
jgi:UDP-N-acetylmuramate dehydrogenase